MFASFLFATKIVRMYSTLDLTKNLKKINMCKIMLVALGLAVIVTRNIGLPMFLDKRGVPYMYVYIIMCAYICVCVCVCV